MLNQKTNKEVAKSTKKNYSEWKNNGLSQGGYFIIFNGFQHSNKLKNISGNALKLYIYLGINSNSQTGEVWHSNKKISNYFNRSERTIRSWMQELESMNLIKRMQLEFNGESHTYLQTYNLSNESSKEIFRYKYRLKCLEYRKKVNLKTYENDIIYGIEKVIKDCYISVYKEYFEIKSYKPIDKNILRKIGKNIKDTNNEFGSLTKVYNYVMSDGTAKTTTQLFERIK